MSIKKIIKKNNLLHSLWRRVDWIITKKNISKDVRIIPNRLYKKQFGVAIDWANPKNLIEKIYWLQLFSDTTLWTKCADKYRVRRFVKDKGCSEILNELYDVWNNAKDIDWDSLPNSFVLKTNNSCGQIILVKDKSQLNKAQAAKDLNQWLKFKYGYRDAQFHYTKIKPCIIAEKLFENEANPQHSLIDYKIWCFNGEPDCILVVYNRTKDNYLLSTYDLNWNNISDRVFNSNNIHVSGENIPKPESLNQMINYAKKLSDGFPQVRVDFYEIDKKPVFGEMTFTTGYGYFNNDFYDYLGSKIDLQKAEKLNNIISPLN